MKKTPLFVLTGPTAVGKTQIACEAALRLNGEIVSADSMQVYQWLDIGTSKPPRDILQRIPHHLIDIVPPTETFDAVRYRAKALKAIEEIRARNRQPLVVGGSGLYIKVLLDGIFPGPSADRRLRETLYQEAAADGAPVLYGRLKEMDPESASIVHHNDLRKIVRALEVYYQNRQPISKMKPCRTPLDDQYEIRVVGLNRPRAELYRRIEDRVNAMFSDGLLEECRGLIQLPLSQTARQALGYKEIFESLEGKISLEEAIRLVKRNTRRYAKRQLTWFRHEPRLQWVAMDDGRSVETVVEEVIEKFTP